MDSSKVIRALKHIGYYFNPLRFKPKHTRVFRLYQTAVICAAIQQDEEMLSTATSEVVSIIGALATSTALCEVITGYLPRAEARQLIEMMDKANGEKQPSSPEPAPTGS